MKNLLFLLIVGGSLLAASWFALPIWKVDVSGTRHLKPRAVAKMAGLLPGNPWLWISRWRAGGLEREPWIVSASVTRRWPGKVEVRLVERTPAAVYVAAGATPVVVARDGTRLPGAPRPRVRIGGMGGSCPRTSGRAEGCLRESLEVAALLAPLGVREVRYSPAGFLALTDRGEIWSDSYASLRKHGGGVRMATGTPGAKLRVNVYPWGVSLSP